MNSIIIYKEVFGDRLLHTIKEISDNLDLINLALALKGGEIDTLHAAFKDGPIEDGHVPSKLSRDVLVEKGLLAKVVVKGEWGYQACTYKGAWAWKIRIANKELQARDMENLRKIHEEESKEAGFIYNPAI